MTTGERTLLATILATLTMLVILYQAAICGASESRVSISVRPRVIMAGGAFWLTCRVPRDSHNRLLEYGVVDLRPGSQRDLEGDAAQITWKVLVERVPCDVGPAYCAVKTDDGRWERAALPITVAGCEGL